MTTLSIAAPTTLADRVAATLATQAELKREAAALAAVQAAETTHAEPWVKRPAPPAVLLGRMAETAWALLTPEDKVQGVKMWKLAAMANLHFIPVPERKLYQLHGGMMVFRLARPSLVPGADPVPDAKLGFAFVTRPMPGQGQALAGLKMFDHEGRNLVVLGEVPVLGHEVQSPFTEGILDGSDELPPNWVYRTRAKVRSQELTDFVALSLPLRGVL